MMGRGRPWHDHAVGFTERPVTSMDSPRVLAVAVVLLLTDRFVPGHAATVQDQSVAVLPLTNESGDARNDYFSEGLSEQLISDFSRIDALRVIGRSSSFRFRSGDGLTAIVWSAQDQRFYRLLECC